MSRYEFLYVPQVEETSWAVAFGNGALNCERKSVDNQEASATLDQHGQPIPDLTKLGMLADISPDGLIAARHERGEDGRISAIIITIANRQAAELLGCEASMIEKQDLLQLLPQLARPEHIDRLLAVIHSGDRMQIDVPNASGGVRRWLRLTMSPVCNGIVFGLSDVTDLRRALYQLERANLRLEQQKSELVVLHDAVKEAHNDLLHEVELRKKLESELRILAQTDSLTGLANRRTFIEKSLAMFVAAQRYHYAASILTLDIDHFKSVNDEYGHAAGDAVLQTISLVMSTATRVDIDIPARIGGEEFALLLPHTDENGAMALAERVRSIIEATATHCGDHFIHVTASIGVATMRENESYEETLARADIALYAAKRAGRNRCVAASEVESFDTGPAFLFI